MSQWFNRKEAAVRVVACFTGEVGKPPLLMWTSLFFVPLPVSPCSASLLSLGAPEIVSRQFVLIGNTDPFSATWVIVIFPYLWSWISSTSGVDGKNRDAGIWKAGDRAVCIRHKIYYLFHVLAINLGLKKCLFRFQLLFYFVLFHFILMRTWCKYYAAHGKLK